MEINLPYKNNFKSTHTYRENLKKEGYEKKRNILHLILKYLIDNNLNSTAEALQIEGQIGSQYQVCDNVDLEIILEEYQSYYYTKFQKNPKIVRKLNENEQQTILKKKTSAKEKPKKIETASDKSDDSFQFDIHSLSKGQSVTELKSLCDFENYSTEWREMADQIIKQFVPKTLGITFKDCIGLNETIETLKEAIIYPLNYPELFKNVCTWKGILLYGPPGNGKTLLAKALTCEAPSTVINVTSSAFISKWRGESEKMVKVLFDVAKLYSPTTIFIDEIDALASVTQDHEASRRFKSELLIQIDGIMKSEEVFVLATTNNPWNINNALLRRFEKRILVPLPSKNAREEIFRFYFKKNDQYFDGEVIKRFSELTGQFSGSDIKTVCKEVEMIAVREKLKEIKSGRFDRRNLATRKAKLDDVMTALEKVKPCLEKEVYHKYVEWETKYGAT